MTIGFLAQLEHFNIYRLLDSVTATNSPPSGASAGLDISTILQTFTKISVAELEVFSTAGSATMTVTGRLWVYDSTTTKWFPCGSGTGAAKGVINDGAAIDETGTDALLHTQPLYDLHVFERIYLEITAIGGTNTAVTANIKIPREVA